MPLDRTDTSSFDPRLLDAPGVRLLVEESGRPPRVVQVFPLRPVRVGRAEGLELSLDDARASRQHAVLSFDGKSVTVKDQGSSNGTFVNDKRIESNGTVTVEPGDLVLIGNTRIVVVATTGASRPETHGPVLSIARDPSEVIAEDPASVALFALIRRLAASDLPVLVQGETGAGKEVVARSLHRFSPRSGGPFIAINCATLAESLAESELFGHEKGAFTGAVARKQGVFEAADGGTLLLDEVGELSTTNQARLLRALQERVVVRVGATRPTPVNVRVVAATNRDLAVDVARGRFREDLYFRLNGVTIAVPALRSRPRDILPLVDKILHERGRAKRLGPGVAAALQAYRWPGNVRELRNAVECALALCEGEELGLEHLPPAVRGDAAVHTAAQIDGKEENTLRERVDGVERGAIIAALEACGWNQSRAARELGISRRALIYKMERYGLKPRAGTREDRE